MRDVWRLACRVCPFPGVMCVALWLMGGAWPRDAAGAETVAALPAGVQAVWDLSAAWRESTATQERVCINGLWRWQPAPDPAAALPAAGWGHVKVPGCWPGITDYMQKDCQTVYPHPSWGDVRLGAVRGAWYQREVTVPDTWAGRRIVLQADYLCSHAAVLVDGQQAGTLRYPGGELDLTAVCRPGTRQMLSMLVVAMPLKGVMLSYNDTASAREVEGTVARRGLCGDVYLASMPAGPRITDVKVVTSVRQASIQADVALESLAGDAEYTLELRVLEGERTVQEFTSAPFDARRLQEGRITVSQSWLPDKLWDLHTPQHMYELQVALRAAGGHTLDASLPRRFGFREFWIDGRDFYLNGTRIFLSSVPLDNAQVGAAWATYAGARESLARLASCGINFVYTHNYGCEPGTHLSFEEILRAADDAGMLVALSQPHFGHYDWDSSDAEQANGYAQHAAFYVRVAQNHPSVVAYATSHNATGYGEDMNPDLIDGVHDRRGEWSQRNVTRALRAEAIIRRLDSSRVVYHHSSGNLGALHTCNFYANFTPVQEMSDWFEHWSTRGVKPLFTCEYSVPMSWDWTLYRGWYRGQREFGGAVVPWEFCVAEWNAQFLGDPAYQISDAEKANLRWEAQQFRAGRRWHRWDYPHHVGSSDFTERYPVYAQYLADNWRAFRTWELSANSPWDYTHYWTLRPGVDRGRQELAVDWQHLQRPGFSPDYIHDRYQAMDLSYNRSDWLPTVAADALLANNRPLLAYLAGKPAAFTSKDHVFCPGETVEKQLIVINNSRETVQCSCAWSLDLPERLTGACEYALPTGQQERTPLAFALPDQLAPGQYVLRAEVRFHTGETQQDSFCIDVLPPPAAESAAARVALFDPRGETRALCDALQIPYAAVDAGAQLAASDILVVGKNALTVGGPAPDITRVRDGLKVVLFEQSPDVLEKRFGFRVATYGLRRVFCRIPDHPVLKGLGPQHLCDWRGEATLVPPRLEYLATSHFGDAPTVRWCGIPVSRVWRCGNRGTVASALIEKPACGDFLPILDGGFGLQYSPLAEYREGRGMIVFCQLDVTGRTERDPAADMLVRNLVRYTASWQPVPRRSAAYAGDPAWRQHLEAAGIPVPWYRGGEPAVDEVLIVGPGGGRQLAEHAAPIRRWLETGGHLLALGLEADEANSFLPAPVSMKRAEHIAAHFAPFGAGSLLAGISPADVHHPAPREVPLVSAGAQVVGDGILGLAERTQVVFCQLPPESVDPALGRADAEQHNLKRTYRRTCFLITRLLGNLGVAGTTPLLTRFSTPVPEDAGASVVRNGTFAADSDADGVPDEWLCSAAGPEATCRCEELTQGDVAQCMALSCPPTGVADQDPPTTMLAQHDVPVTQGQWYRIGFQARAEGLARNSVSVTVTNMATWQTLVAYQRFSPGPQWQRYSFEVQATETVQEKTRFQIWYSDAGRLWIADVRMDPIPDPAQGRWLEGLYLDVPVEWDDPYRFFRW